MTGHQHAKKNPLDYTHHKNYFNMDHRPQRKKQNHKILGQ
jgi:hypothetical protein